MMITRQCADRILAPNVLTPGSKHDPSARQSPLPRMAGLLLGAALLCCVGCDQKSKDDDNASIDENPTVRQPAPDQKQASATVARTPQQDEPVDDPVVKVEGRWYPTDDEWKQIVAGTEELEKEKELPKKSAEELLRSFISPDIIKPDDVEVSSWLVTQTVAWRFNRLVEKELRKRGPAIVPELKKLYSEYPQWFYGNIFTGSDGPLVYVGELCDQLLRDFDEEWRKQARKRDGLED